MNAYAVARVALTLVNGYSGDYPWALFKFPAFWKQVLSFIDEVVFLSLAGVYLVPIFIWMVASFRRDDLNSILNRDRLRVRPDTGSGRDMGGAKKVIVRGE